MNDRTSNPNIPPQAWKRSIGQGWDNPYTVRYASNLDDGPWHGMPLGGFGAGCIGRSPRGDFNLWHIDGGEHIFRSLPACQFSVFEETKGKMNQKELWRYRALSGGFYVFKHEYIFLFQKLKK